MTRWVGVGQSAAPDARAAGREAVEAALQGREDAQLLIVLGSIDYDLQTLLAGVDPGETPLVGGSTAGHFGPDGVADAGVVIMALGGEGFGVATEAVTELSQGRREAGEAVAGCVSRAPEREHKALLLFADSLSGDPQEIVRGAYGKLGASVPLVGGCAGDDLTMTRTFQFHGYDVLSDAVVGVALNSDAPLGIGVRHGWQRVGEPLLVTKSGGNQVHTLNDKPALDTYLQRLDAPAAISSDVAEFNRFALAHPLGLERRTGEDHVRFVGNPDVEERRLGCIAEVPQGAVAWLMEGDADSVLEATAAACDDALAPLGDAPALGLLAFDCIARRGMLGEHGETREMARIAQRVPDVPMAGFYTYGEIARTRGISGFHNQTLVCLAIG